MLPQKKSVFPSSMGKCSRRLHIDLRKLMSDRKRAAPLFISWERTGLGRSRLQDSAESMRPLVLESQAAVDVGI